MVMLTTTRNALKYLGDDAATDTWLLYRNGYADAFQVIDAALAKANFLAATDPTTNDDEGDGYASGSLWFNLTDGKIFICEDASTSAAVWRQVWPAIVDDIDLSDYLLADGSQALESALILTQIATPDAPAANLTKIYAKLDNKIYYRASGGAETAIAAAADHVEIDGGNAMTGALTMTQIATPSEPASGKTAIYPKSDGKLYYFSEGGSETEVGSGSGSGGGFWSDVPGTPTRIGDTSFSITDTSNANLYDKAFGPGTVLKWEKSGGGAQFAKVTAASYGTNTVTITIVGNTLSAGFTAMKYCIHRAEQEVFIVPGTLPGNTATADIAKTRHMRGDIYVFSAKIWYKTGPTTTKGVWDINDDGSTIFTTKPEVAASATEGAEQVSDCLSGTATTAVADKSLITVDYDSGHATTPGADAYIYLFWMPVAWRYLS